MDFTLAEKKRDNGDVLHKMNMHDKDLFPKTAEHSCKKYTYLVSKSIFSRKSNKQFKPSNSINL